MNKKWKIILLVMLMIFSICLVFITVFISDSRDNLATFVDYEITNVRALIATIEDSHNKRYRTRIKTVVNYQDFPRHENLISAFARRDRDELQRLSLPYLQIFQKENPYFSTFSWVTPDNHVFLRVHLPGKFGDDISKMRPDIVAANKEHQQASYMLSKSGLEYRIAHPVSYEGSHVGVLQFGMKLSVLLDSIQEKLNISTGIAIPNESAAIINYPGLPSYTGFTHTIKSQELDHFKGEQNGIDWGLRQQRVSLQDKTYIIVNAFDLFNHRKESQGYIFVALDISKPVQALRSRIIFIVTLSTLLLLFSFLVLYSSYGSLVQKVLNLNQTLQNNNEGLEDQVKERTRSLQQQKEELQCYINVIDDVGLALSVVDPDYRLRNMNRSFIEKFGDQQHHRCYRAIMEQDMPCQNCQLKEVLEHKKIASYQVKRADGHIFEILASPLHNADGSVSCMEIIRDITDQKAQEEVRLDAHLEKAHLKKLESLKTMAGAIAHRFNNAMMAVQGNLELMTLTLPADSNEYQMATSATLAARGAAQVGSMMLSYVGQQPVQLQNFAFDDVVRESVTELKNRFQPSMSLRFAPPLESLYCLMDQKQMKEVIDNILINAIEALEYETGAIEITFGTEYVTVNSFPLVFQGEDLKDGLYAFCQISDSGHGIDQDNLQRIFEPFYTTRFVGRGLGLALSEGIMLNHNGAITVESSVTEGTTVRVFLPFVESLMPVMESPPNEKTEPSLLVGHVLVVDDEDMVLSVGKRMLEVLGFTVHTAVNGQDAVAMIRAQDVQFCAVLMDISMPEMDGIAAMHITRTIQPDLPVILSSGYAEEDFTFTDDQGGHPEGFLRKPFELSMVRTVFEQVLL